MPELPSNLTEPRWRSETLLADEVAPLFAERLRRSLPWCAGMLFLMGAIGGLCSWLNDADHPRLVPCWMTAFQGQRWPALTAAEQDHQRLVAGGFFSGNDLLNPAFGQQSALEQQLENLRTISSRETVVLYVSAYAGVDQQGEVYCLPSDANPDLETDRVQLREIVSSLRKCPARHKLLVLDLSWPAPDPRFGLVNSLVLPRARALLKELPDPHRMVLTSTADGQPALTSDELGQSVFGYYLEQGLRGLSDGWNPTGKRDGRVSVYELGSFVQAHVSRWARLNRETEQVPLQLGEAEDFELSAVSLTTANLWPGAPAEQKYPTWLLSAWQEIDRWNAAGYRKTYPRIYQQWGSAIRRAEDQWQAGMSAKPISARLAEIKQQLLLRISRQEQLIPRPVLHSLALLRATDVQADPAAAKALQEMYTGIAVKTANQPPDKAATIREQLIASFIDATQKTPSGPYAMVLHDQLLQFTAPTPDDIRLLDRLARAKQPEPFFAETLLLRRLAELAANNSTDWRPATVHQAVLTDNITQQLSVKALTFPWVRGMLETAFQQQHDAQVMLWSRGFVSWEAADAQLRAAEASLQMVFAYQMALTDAQVTLSTAGYLLPRFFGQKLLQTDLPDAWLAATNIASSLADRLEPPTSLAPEDQTDLQKQITDIRRQVFTLIDLYTPIEPHDFQRVLEEAQQDTAGPVIYLQAKDILASPFINAEQRAQMWPVAHRLSLKLLAETMRQDQAGTLKYHPPLTVADAVIPSQFAAAVADECLQFREGLDLLRITGLPESDLAQADALCQRVMNAQPSLTDATNLDAIKDLAQLAEQIQSLWFVRLTEAIQKATDPGRQVRLARFYPPFGHSQVLDNPLNNPLVRMRMVLHQQRWAWLAERYQYAAKDILGPRFYAEAARDYTAAASHIPQQAFLQLSSTATPPTLSPGAAAGAYPVQWKWNGTPLEKNTSTIRCFSPSLYLHAKSNRTSLAGSIVSTKAAAATPLEIELSLAPEALPSDLLAVRGCLLVVQNAGRSFHFLVELPSLSQERTLELLVGRTPLPPAASLNELDLRPIKGWHHFFLFARNLAQEPADARIELVVGDQILATAESKLAAGQTLPVLFSGEAPKPNTELPEVTGPIRLRAVDLTTGKLLAEQNLPCDLLSPKAYLAVTDVLFDASAPSQNSLSVGVRAINLEQGPPITVQLEVPANQIPGLMGIEGGAFVGSLPNAGSTLMLQAKNMQFTPSARQPGRFYVDVDDYPRAFAFRCLFPREGDPIVPLEDSTPRLQINAPQMGIAGPGFAVSLLTDNAPTGARLDVAIGQMVGRIFRPEMSQALPTARHQRIGLAPHGPTGELLAQASMRDWNLQLDTTGIVGQRQLRARMLDVDGHEILSVQQTILLDDTPPEQVSFVSAPEKAAIKGKVTLRAIGLDSLSGISEVAFYPAPPVDGKVPAGIPPVYASPIDAGGTLWQAELTMPSDPGRTSLTVAFTNGVGLTTIATTKIVLLDPAAMDVGAIQGTVTEGPRPQPGLDVQLLDAAGKPAASAKTNSDGLYQFEKVKSGDYTISVVKPTSERKGAAPVKVQSGSTVKADISLAL